jgi:hypothetical protein
MKYKKSNINPQPIIVKLLTVRTNLKMLPKAIDITLKRIHSILAHTNLGTIKIIEDEKTYDSTEENGVTKT